MLLWHATFVGHYGTPSPDFVNLTPNFTFLRTYFTFANVVCDETLATDVILLLTTWLKLSIRISRTRGKVPRLLLMYTTVCVYLITYTIDLETTLDKVLVLATLLATVYFTCGFCSFTSYSCDRKCHWYMIWAACFACGFCSITSYSCDRKCHWYMIW